MMLGMPVGNISTSSQYLACYYSLYRCGRNIFDSAFELCIRHEIIKGEYRYTYIHIDTRWSLCPNCFIDGKLECILLYGSSTILIE